VRQLVGYSRDVGEAAYEALQQLYDVVGLSINFFQPSLKLLCKECRGGKVRKKYDAAKTPSQRVLESEQVRVEVKAALQQEYLTLGPLALLRQIRERQAVLWKLALGEVALPAVAALVT
jgi:hypothetical protein